MAMKYRDPKTGDVFENIEMAIWNDCRRRDACDADCALFDIRKSSACYDYVISHPTEAARRMGYEVVEDHIGDAAEMVKEEPMEKKDKPRFTKEEVADAKAILRILPHVDTVERMENGLLYCYDREMELVNICGGLFPSLRPGQTVTLEEIIQP